MQSTSKGKKFIIIIIILFVGGLIYFISNAAPSEFKEDLGVKTFLVEDEKVECYGEGKMECLIVNGEYFYNYIKGFDYEEGYKYTILVRVKLSPEYKKIILGQLADASIYTYKLIKVIDKTKTTETTDSPSIEINFLSTDVIDIINSKFTLDLYGYDLQLADASATLITRKEYSATSIPFSITLPFPDNPIKLIEKNNGGRVIEDNYYITISWDNNGDGNQGGNLRSTPGDISIDWNNQKSEDSEIKLIDGKKYTIYLKQVD